MFGHLAIWLLFLPVVFAEYWATGSTGFFTESLLRVFLIPLLLSGIYAISFSLPTRLVIMIAAVFCFGHLVPAPTVKVMYTISLAFKEVLTFLLPFMVFTFVLNGIVSLKRGAPVVLALLMGSIFFSNALFSTTTYCLVRNILSSITGPTDITALAPAAVIEPLAHFELPHLVSSQLALVSAIILGCIISFIPIPLLDKIINLAKWIIEWILMRLFIPLLPIYILGFLLKIQHEGMLTQLLRQYGGAVVIIVTLQVTFLALFYLVASSFRLRKAYEYVMNALPSYITAFSTMSSVATIPVSIVSAEKNTHNRPLADVAMPIMANVHLMGDSVGIPVLVLVTLSIFSGVIPSFSTYLTFVFYFCTSMFAVSGIPGGAIIVMIPILVDLFNFTPDMVSVITTLYLLLDSFETAGNVMGDGALIIIVDKILKRMGFARTHESSEKDTN